MPDAVSDQCVSKGIQSYIYCVTWLVQNTEGIQRKSYIEWMEKV